MIADRTLCLDKTATRLVPEGSPESAYQLVNAGREIPQEEVERLGLYLDAQGKISQRGADPEIATEPAEDVPAEKKSSGKNKK